MQRRRALPFIEQSSAVKTELDTLYEEIGVAEEELRAQHEDLLAAHSALAGERAIYLELFESAPVPYVITDRTGAICNANTAASHLFGVRADRLQGKPLAVFIDAAGRPGFRRDLARITGSGLGAHRLTLQVSGRDGRRRAVSAIVGVVRGRAHEVLELRWLLVDESLALQDEREQMIAAANDARAAAEASDQAKSQLLATVSHELRTPLAAIAGYSELLEMGLRGPLSTEQLTDIRRMRGAQEHMLSLLDDLLLYFRLGLGGLTADVAKTRVSDILTGLSSFVAPQANQKRIAIEIASCDPDVVVLADADRARQILINLIMNAVKFSPAGETVRVGLLRDDPEVVVVQVCDAGPGIAPEKREAVFEPFVQLGAVNTRGGFGLGLAISRRLAELMGGSLTLAPDATKGSVFSLALRRA